MENLIAEIHSIIKDYRIEEGIGISKDRIREWINQFSELDREFLLNELLLIFKKRYISKERAQGIVREMITFLSKTEKYQSPKEFLADCSFIDHQPEGKSQKVLLDFLNEITTSEFGINILRPQTANTKFYVYFDDILCTGDTIFKGIGMLGKGWFFQKDSSGKINKDIFFENKAKFIWAYFAIHKHGVDKAIKRLYFATGKRGLNILYAWVEEFIIDNDYERLDSKLEFLFPIEEIRDEQIDQCEKQIEDKITTYCGANDYKAPPKHFYRKAGTPQKETLFSSPENRVKFERIMLKKCIEVYNSADNDNIRMRPLGYGFKNDMNFGFGALIFSWRNVPFNVPMIFWYPHRGWIPLFERKFVTYSGGLSSSLSEDV